MTHSRRGRPSFSKCIITSLSSFSVNFETPLSDVARYNSSEDDDEVSAINRVIGAADICPTSSGAIKQGNHARPRKEPP